MILFKFLRLVSFLLLTAVSCGHIEENKPISLFPLNQVELTSGPFKEAQETDLKYILEMDVDRLLAPYLKEAGIEPIKQNYGNWEGGGLNGHIGGHYLSALAMMSASTNDSLVHDRMNYMLDWLDSCQKENGNGYIGGIPDGQRIWNEISNGDIRADFFSLNGGWVPLYNIHKIYAGLRDVYLFTGSEKAKRLWVGLSDWWIDLTEELTSDQFQKMLKSEHGGLNEVFADLYDVTGEQKYLTMARKLSHQLLLEPLMKEEDLLNGTHANTQIPKVVGFQRVAELAGDTSWHNAAIFFWNTVVNNRTISIGGNSVREHFHPANDFGSMVRSEQGPETCNTYNMLRLSKMLFTQTGNTKYIDFYERGLYNHILSSQHPNGGFVYFTPARPQHYRVYSQPQEGMWCCVGSGLENHAKYGELIYAKQGDDLLVNLIIASKLNWEKRGVVITQETSFPETSTASLRISTQSPQSFSIKVRKPDWWVGEPLVDVNSKNVDFEEKAGYLVIEREWSDGDEMKIDFPMKTRLEFLPDGSSWVSFVRGPIVMAAATDSVTSLELFADDSRMGHVANDEFYPIDEAPLLVGDEQAILSSLEEIDPARFSLGNVVYKTNSKNGSFTLMPFYTIHESRYMLYWPITDSAGLEQHVTKMKEEEDKQKALRSLTVDAVQPGQQQPEADHLFEGEGTFGGYSNEKSWRSGRGWFSYLVKDSNHFAKYIRLSYDTDRTRSFEVYINNQLLKEVTSAKNNASLYLPIDELDLEESFRIKIKSKSGLPLITDLRLMSDKQ